MSEVVTFKQVEEKVLTVRGQQVILDSDVAALYSVETKRVNEAVSNNPDKFPEGYILQLSKPEWHDVRAALLSSNDSKSGSSDEPVENFDRLGTRKHAAVQPKAFTEKGLYMLATILKSPQATQTTLAIVEAFAQLRELSRAVAALAEAPEEAKQKALMQRSGEIFADLLGSDLHATGSETTLEINFALMKFKHTIRRG